MGDDGILSCSYDVVDRPKWVPRTLRGRAALASIDAAYALKSRSYRAYCQLARNRTLARIRIHAPFEILYSVIYLALRRTAFPEPSGRRPS